MQKEKRSFDRFQGVEKTWVNGVSAGAIEEFPHPGRLLKWRILFWGRAKLTPPFPLPARAGRGKGGTALPLVGNAVPQQTDSRHRDLHHIAGLEPARRIEARPGADRRAGDQDVAG